MKKSVVAALLAAAGAAGLGQAAQAQECYLGEVRMFAGNFTPRGWGAANGQVLSIAENTALFSLLGCTYGGDCRVTFALPDLRGRVPVGYGQGPGLTNRQLGEKFGAESVTPPMAAIEAEPGSDPVVVGGVPQSTTPPSLAIGYHICMQGLYPSRS